MPKRSEDVQETDGRPDDEGPRRVRGRVRLAVAAALATALVAAWLWIPRSGVEVVVVNAGDEVARAVEVGTTAGVYVLGDLPPGATARTLVGARGETSVWIGWTRRGGTRNARDVGPYFEGTPAGASSYGGTVRFALDGDTVAAEDDVRIVLTPLSRGTAPEPDRTSAERSPR